MHCSIYIRKHCTEKYFHMVYIIYFWQLYLPSNPPLPEGREDTALEALGE